MKNIKLSDFLKQEIKPFILGVFMSRIMQIDIDNSNYFYGYTSFRSSKFIYKDDFDFVNYAPILVEKYNHHSGYYNWEIHRSNNTNLELRFYIYNDLSMTSVALYNALYNKLLSSPAIVDNKLNDFKIDFIRGFIEPRGSIDITMKLIAQDYFFDNLTQLKKAQILTDLMSLPLQYANFNARNLQPQYVSGENKRNAQFRVNSFYYASTIGFINDYKALIFEKGYNYTSKKYINNNIIYFDIELNESTNYDILFIKYLNFFTNNIYKKNLSKSVIESYREKLGFNTKNPNPGRDQTLIDIFNEISEDKCAICGTTKTYENKKTGRQFFEIHHMISFHNGKECDNIANLVKLCPTCHRKMKRNAAPKDDQIKSILKILHEHEEVFEFTSSYLNITDINLLAEKIWSMLG